MEFKIGDRIIGQIEVLDVKKGGFGIVYIGRYVDAEIMVAIKSFQDCFFNSEAADAFYHEAEVWVKLGLHENIVAAFSVTSFGEKPHIMLEYVDGGNLEKRIRNGPLDNVSSIDFAIQFCNGMIYANDVDLGEGRRGIVHRDIDPKNILLTKEGQVKVTDFGLVKALGETPLKVAGKPPYMSPEQFSGLNLDTRSDIYSFGVVLYQMLTGRLPFYNPDWSWEDYEHNHLYEAPTSLRQIDASIPSELDQLVSKCLEKRMEKRYQRFSDIRNDLEKIDKEIFEGRAQETSPVSTATPVWIARARVPWIAKGLSLQSLGKIESALECFDQALKLDPSDAIALRSKGGVLQSLGKHVDAIKCFDEALRIQPRDNFALTRKGYSLFWTGKPKEALVCFNEALTVNVNDPVAWKAKGRLLAQLGNTLEAKKCFERVIQIDPGDPDAWYNLGRALYISSNYHAALKCFKEALEIDQRHAEAWNFRGACLLELGNVEESIQAFEKALELDPGNEGYKANRDQALKSLRR